MIRWSTRYTFTQKIRSLIHSKCRFDIAINEKWTNNLLPSRQFGKVVLTSSGGIMDHEEARRKHLGGKILGFFF